MEKAELVKVLSQRLRMEPQQAEQAVELVIAELVSPAILRKPGAEVAFLDNSCTNNCKAPEIAEQVTRPR